MTYQDVTGTLNPGAHAGSYNGQDAYSDMLIINENDSNISQLYAHGWDNGRNNTGVMCNGLQRPANSNGDRGGTDMNENREPTMLSNRKGHNGVADDGTATTLTAQEKERPLIGTSTVRRLTPTECERLQGFPDGWTDIGEWVDTKGKIHKESSDSARYKALGNSIATPFWFWLLRRISAQYERPATLGSLFDGIGGFPLCWEKCNGEGTALWASEIEEFPIAVTKYHFPKEENNAEEN